MALKPEQISDCLTAMGAFVQRMRPPPELLDKIDYKAELVGSSVILSDVRPMWNSPRRKRASPFAKINWVETRKEWRLYWMKSDLKWHSYEYKPVFRSLRKAMVEVEEDRYNCFFG
jgi:hypothetical protein